MSDPYTVMLYINCIHSPGGAERVFCQLANRFAECGWRSILVTSYREPGRVEYPLDDRVERHNMEAERLYEDRLRRNVHRIAKLRRLLRECRPDILITCMQEPNFRGMMASMGLPVRRMVSVCNACEKEYPGLMGKFVGKVLMPMAEGCVFQTEEEKRWFPERLQKKGRIIMNQVNESFFGVQHSGERHDIVTVGKLRAQKNQALLIRAFSRIAGEIGDNLLLYGAGELEDELRGLIESLHLSERVKLMGLSTDVANDIKDAKCFVMSSDYEGLPNALLEAMALGLPCVSTDCEGGGPAMMIENGVNGLLVPMREEKALADAMLYMLQNPDEAERMGKAARETAEGFRPDTIFARWKQYAEDILNG